MQNRLFNLFQSQSTKTRSLMVSDFLIACSQNNIESVNSYLNQLSRAEIVYNNNEALDRATRHRNWQIVKRLLKEKTIRDLAAINSNDALSIAVEAGRDDIVEDLLKIQSVRDNANVEHNYCLQLAMVKKVEFPKIAKLLLSVPAIRLADKSANLDGNHVDSIAGVMFNAQDSEFLSLCRKGDWGVALELLLNFSVRSDAAAKGNLALLLACEAGIFEMVKALLLIHSVRDGATINNNYPLRLVQARINSFPKIVEHLSQVPSVVDIFANERQFSAEDSFATQSHLEYLNSNQNSNRRISLTSRR